MKKRRHPKILPNPLPVYIENPRYPEMVRLSFEDGHVRNYRQEVRQPPPFVVRKKDLNRMFRKGAGYREKNRVQKIIGLMKIFTRDRIENIRLTEENERLRKELRERDNAGHA